MHSIHYSSLRSLSNCEVLLTASSLAVIRFAALVTNPAAAARFHMCIVCVVFVLAVCARVLVSRACREGKDKLVKSG